MTITPRSLRMLRFGSFDRQQTFEFPRAPGLYFMTGRNEAEPRLDANGTGKSTVWKALTWLLYERTAEGLRAGDVCHWDHDKGAEVSLEFSRGENGPPEFVTRTWKPNSWKHQDLFGNVVDLGKDPQNAVLAELRLSLDAWLCAVLVAQGEDMFLDMKKDRQTALFSSVMDLDAWDARADRASRAAAEEDRACRDLERRLADARGRLDVLERHDQAGDAERWERDRRERLERLSREHGDLSGRRKGLREALEGAQEREAEAREGVGAARTDAALEDAYAQAEAEVRRLEDARLEVRVRRDAVAAHAERLQERDAACPHCGRPFDTRHWQQEAEKADRNRRALSAEHDQLSHKITVARNRADVLDADLRKAEERYAAARRALADAEHEASGARQDLLQCDRQLDRLEEDYERAEREANPYAGAVERARREADALRRDVADLGRELDERERLRSVKQFWVRGFREVRLREIASALGELEVEVNSCVTELGLVDWELEFRVDRETKAGTVQRGFSVFVRGPGTDRAVPWEAWSGGERQRLRLAGNMGLGNLIRARTGCDLPLEVWDEPTNGLSAQGEHDLFAALAARARREGRVVFLVDHAAHSYGGFAGTCTVVKTPSGSRVRASWA